MYFPAGQYEHEELINSVEYLPKSHQEQNWPSLKEEPSGVRIPGNFVFILIPLPHREICSLTKR